MEAKAIKMQRLRGCGALRSHGLKSTQIRFGKNRENWNKFEGVVYVYDTGKLFLLGCMEDFRAWKGNSHSLEIRVSVKAARIKFCSM